MDDAIKHGTIWTESELDLIVADYFVMLGEDLSGRYYVKADHNVALSGLLGRTRGSVEFKYQNISAVLDKLGMPWIPGYKPASHHQGVIVEAIGRYLSLEPDAGDPRPSTSQVGILAEIFVPAPKLEREEPMPVELRQLIAKLDPSERDRRNRALGKAGEEFVLEIERRQLVQVGRKDLAQRVRWVAEEEGDGAGYDVLSYAVNGSELLIEVKTTNGSARTPFFITRNELNVAAARANDWRIYRVHKFAQSPRIFTIAAPLDGSVHFRPELWRASFGQIPT